ncbi:hypothetical protein C5167_021111 [Papaver somniferum]|uniref:Uncharacterized protein n=1 Tax=Papaver somniferum TaxID=3469 RepID=A0A4Y7IUZ2_PAPSO|nr:hypothetical protein C5167_021111 [Papaver somniferum]
MNNYLLSIVMSCSQLTTFELPNGGGKGPVLLWSLKTRLGTKDMSPMAYCKDDC